MSYRQFHIVIFVSTHGVDGGGNHCEARHNVFGLFSPEKPILCDWFPLFRPFVHACVVLLAIAVPSHVAS